MIDYDYFQQRAKKVNKPKTSSPGRYSVNGNSYQSSTIAMTPSDIVTPMYAESYSSSSYDSGSSCSDSGSSSCD